MKTLDNFLTFIKSVRSYKDERIFGIAAILLIAFAISYAAPVAQSLGKAQSAFPPTVCPAKIGDGTTSVELPKYRTAVRHVMKNSTSLYKSASSVENISSNPLLVDSNPGTSVALNSSGSYLGAVVCESGTPDEWFVGGSGGLTSKSQLDIVNSGLSPATIEVTGYSSKQALPMALLSVPANSDRLVSLDSLIPGDDSVALHVVTRAGRVTTFLFDQRKKGLSSLGLDFVSPQDAPSTHLVIPALTQGAKGKLSTVLRVLVPGQLDANVKVTINSGDGAFTPVGFDGRTIKHGSVLDIPFTDLTSSTPMSIIIDSDQPIIASALSSISGGDFAWSTPVSALTKLSMNFSGLNSKFVFTGDSINVSIAWTTSYGKRMSANVSGSDIAFWNPGQAGMKSVTFTSKSGTPVYAGGILGSTGLAYLPLASGAQLERSTLPVVDVHSLTR